MRHETHKSSLAARDGAASSARVLWLIASFVTAGLLPVHAYGQTAPAASPAAAAPWDATVIVGLFSGRPPASPNRGYLDEWFNSAQAGVLVGRHLTTHVKAEIELTTSSEGHRFVERYVQLPSYPTPLPIGADEFTRIREIGAALTYQFLDNEWIHPFVQVGVAADFDRRRTHTWAQSFFTGDPRQPASQVVVAGDGNAAPVTTVSARAVVGAGAKFYVTPRVFVRTDGRFAAGARGQYLTLRVGAGFDF